MKPVYTYKATLIKVVDGDTIHAKVDLGFRTFMDLPFRFYGINAPELKTAEGKVAKDYLISLINIPTALTLKTYKDPEKYGRWLADVYMLSDPVSLNQKMVDSGHAVVYLV